MKKVWKTAFFCVTVTLLLCGAVFAAQFTDVPNDAWYAEAVQFVSDNGLMNGTAADTFSPENSLTRAQFVAIMYRMKGNPSVTESDFEALSALSDIPDNAWYRDAAAWAISNGVIVGYSDHTFRSGNALTRAQLLTLLYRVTGSPKVVGNEKKTFSDEAQASAAFASAIVWARETGIAIGDAENNLNPNVAALRSYTAATLHAFLIAYPDQMSGGLRSPYEKDYRSFLLSAASYPSVPVYPVQDNFKTAGRQIDDVAYRKALTEYRAFHKLDAKYSEGLDSFYRSILSRFLRTDETENKVCSPLNLYMALGMLSEACDGNSRSQILSLLGAENTDEVSERANALWTANYYNDDVIKSVLANSLWANKAYSSVLNQSTLDSIAGHFFASSFQGEAGTEEYDKALQAWLNEHTDGMLEKQASQMKMSLDTVLALVSSISFHTEWKERFDADNTKQDVFQAKSANLTCDFMHETHEFTYGFNYYAGKKFTAIYKQLKNEGSMWLILPNEGVTPAHLLQDEEALRFLTSDKSAWEYQTKADILRVHESIPKFDISSSMNMIDGLKELGATDIFDEKMSDFSPLTEKIPLVVTQVEHDARVSIDEEGCAAVAYTVIMLGAGGGAPAQKPTYEDVYFTLNRPFLFTITGAGDTMLFAGVVNTPVE